MSLEDQNTDRKSLRSVIGRTADWEALARACVCFANGSGGRLLIGVDDGENLPPAGQGVPPELLDRLRKRIGELTVNVQALPSLQRAANGGEFIELIVDRSPNVASTRDGRYFLRVGDTCQPVLGDDVLQLANERPGRPWEAMESAVPRGAGRHVLSTWGVAVVRSDLAQNRLYPGPAIGSSGWHATPEAYNPLKYKGRGLARWASNRANLSQIN
jgi:ATP-dependent DNA helicase RecG